MTSSHFLRAGFAGTYDHGCTFVVVVRTVPYLDILLTTLSSLLLVWLHSLLTTGFACS